jgi:hypothetical protein
MIDDFCNELNSYLKERYSYRKPPAYFHSYNNIICARRTKFDIYLRYKPNNENSLIIARIQFKVTRKGNGRDLLIFFSKIIEKHKIENVYLESVNKNSKEFGEKFGFIDLGNGNMIVSSEKLISKCRK